MVGEQIRIRAQVQGDITEIHILLQHPMETGQRKDENSQALAIHFIQTFSVSHDGKAIIDGQLNTSIAKNPLFAFKTHGIKPGDKITVRWQDNKGDQRQDEIIVR